MAEISRFFADVGGDRLTTAAQFNRIIDQLLQEQSGVIRGLGNALAVTNSGTLAVDINTGSCIKSGRIYENTASVNKTLDAVTSGSKRYDRIVVRVDETARTMLITVIKGVEGANPSPPAIDGTTDVLLAKILIDRSSGSYVYTLTDERVYCDGLVSKAIIAKLNAGTYSEDDIADGINYKRIAAAEATQMRASASSPWSTPPTLYFKDSLRAQIEFASGGQQTVLYDDVGIPSVMQWIPAFNLQDIHADLGTGLHPAFVVNGTAKAGIWIGVYQAKVSGGRAYSWPGQDPTASVNFDTAKGYCTAKGAGWHMMTAWEWAAVALWCLKNGFQPRGNTNYGRSHANTFETGTRSDGYPPGSTSGTARTKTGAGPASWRHNNAFFGIADLVGNIVEWLDGYKIVDGRMYFPDDNNFNLAEASWPAQNAYWDGTVSGAAGAPKLSDTIPVNQTTDSYYNSITGEAGWRSLTYSENYFTSMPLALRQKLAAMLIAPAVTNSTPLFTASGAVYNRNNGERFPLRGGSWYNGAYAGLAFFGLGNQRSASFSDFGFRLAYSS